MKIVTMVAAIALGLASVGQVKAVPICPINTHWATYRLAPAQSAVLAPVESSCVGTADVFYDNLGRPGTLEVVGTVDGITVINSWMGVDGSTGISPAPTGTYVITIRNVSTVPMRVRVKFKASN